MNRLVIIIPLILIMISCRKDRTQEIDITKYKWELQSVTATGSAQEIPEEKKKRENSYILSFQNDSFFSLALSANSAGGHYIIKTKGNITVNSFGAMTEVCCDTEFDNKLLNVIKEVTTYTVGGSTLTFKGAKGEVEFKKK
jgi:heat shock protein HslJ